MYPRMLFSVSPKAKCMPFFAEFWTNFMHLLERCRTSLLNTDYYFFLVRSHYTSVRDHRFNEFHYFFFKFSTTRLLQVMIFFFGRFLRHKVLIYGVVIQIITILIFSHAFNILFHNCEIFINLF